jgi:hypothetical protein
MREKFIEGAIKFNFIMIWKKNQLMREKRKIAKKN